MSNLFLSPWFPLWLGRLFEAPAAFCWVISWDERHFEHQAAARRHSRRYGEREGEGMTAFTVIGVLWFWGFCWQVGYYGGMALDVGLVFLGFRRVEKQTAEAISAMVLFQNRKDPHAA